MELLNRNSEKEEYEKARQLFLDKQYDKACDIFLKINAEAQAVYCYIFSAQLEKALKLLETIKDKTPPVFWLEALVGILSDNIKTIPTPLEIRNFLEIDLTLFLENKFFACVEKLIDCEKFLASINPETYKYFARAFLATDYADISLHYVTISKKVFYNDPEIHFIEGECHLRLNSKDKAKKSFLEDLRVCPDYFPAQNMLEKLKE